jgi:hypothetical protein
MGHRGQKIREAIAHLANDGCDLTDPSVSARLRADDVAFHLGYLEEHCGLSLTVEEIVSIARAMRRELAGRSLGVRPRAGCVWVLVNSPGPEVYN